MRKSSLVVGGIGVLILGACLGPRGTGGRHDARAVALFGRHCAVCHGADGSGRNTLPEDTLWPAARDFGAGLFSLASTRNGVPTQADFELVIRRGMPGSSMPSFDWLPESDIAKLATHVRALGVERAVARSTSVDHLSAFTAKLSAKEKFTPGYPVATPELGEATEAQRMRGREIYLARCAACHGDYGTGRQPVANWAGGLSIHWARDFTAGILKGGASTTELARRIGAGMPAAGMPPTHFPDQQDLVALLAYLNRLIPKDAGDRLVQRRQRLAVGKVARLPAAIDDAAWNGIEADQLVLAPLYWRAGSILRADLKAVHDGRAMRVRVSWRDPSHDEPRVGEAGGVDRLALQFSVGDEPGFFGMGSSDRPVYIWYWHPRAAKGEYGMLDVANRGAPHRALLDVSPHVQLPQRAREFVAKGHESSQDFGRQDRTVRMQARWRDGRWTVMFERELAGRTESDVEFAPGGRLWFALAIWNGQASRSPRDKSFTIWHEFEVR